MNTDFEEIWFKVVTKTMGPFYIQVQDCDGGVDYTIYNYLSDRPNEIDGGVIDNCNSVSDIEEIFNNENIEEIYLLEDACFENGKLHYEKCLKTIDMMGGK